MTRLSEADRRMRQSGLCQRWLGEADAALTRVVREINGPLFEQLLRQSDYDDMACLDLLRHGAPMTGCVGVERHTHTSSLSETKAVHDLMASCRSSNNCLWWELDCGSESKWSQALRQATEEDATRGRASAPVRIEECDLWRVLLHPRFPNVREKPDGSAKVRPIDNLSWAANG